MYSDFKLNLSPEEILVYLRKSRSDDPTLTVEEVLEKHETILDEWSEKHLGAKVPEENKFREVVSGETIADRPEVKRLLKQIEAPRYKAVLVVEVQRISRGDLEDAGRLLKLFRYTNTLVITPPKTYDLQDEYDRDFFERELKRGNEFLEYQKKIMGRGRLLSVQQGNFVGNTAPYGYDKAWVQEGKRKCPTLAINEKEAEVVRMIFDMYVNQDMGRIVIAHKLDQLGIAPPRGRYWSNVGIRDMLANIHYTGKVRWNWRQTISVIEDGEVVKKRPRADDGKYMVYDGKHPAIISEELFNAAQAKRGRNARTKYGSEIRNPLAGLVFCQCGRAMTYRTYKDTDGEERSAPRMLCIDQARCKTSSCLYDEMIEKVIDVLQQCIDDFEIKIKDNNEDAVKFHKGLVKRLEDKLEELDRKEIAYWDKYAEEGMPKSVFDKLNEKLIKEREELQAALSNARDAVPDVVDYQEKLHRFQDALDALKDPDVKPALKNKLLKACIDRIDYNRGKAERSKREPGEERGSRLTVGGHWDAQPMELDIKLRV